MLKKVVTGTGIAATLAAGFLLGSLTLGSALAEGPSTPTPAQATVQSSHNDAAQAAVKSPDTDTVEEQEGDQAGPDEQVGDQAGPDGQEGDQAGPDGQKGDQAGPDGQEGDQAGPNEQQPQYTGSIQVDGTQHDGMTEADEGAALQSKATISAADAEAAALAANTGASVVKTELDNENGVLVYSVELSNGKDVKVDAGTGKVLHTEAGELDGQGEAQGQEAAED